MSKMEETDNEIVNSMALICDFKNQGPERVRTILDFMSRESPECHDFILKAFNVAELLANDPEKIPGYLNVKSRNKHEAIYSALLLVKPDNTLALKEFEKILRILFDEAISKGTKVSDTVRICKLIESTPSLQLIHQSLQQIIERVKQLQIDGLPIKPLAPGIKLWKCLQHKYLNPVKDLPDLDWECFDNDHLEEVEAAHKNSALENLTIVTQDMDGVFSKWLKTVNLINYQWFFNGLSYLEIVLVDKENIESCIAKVNNNLNTSLVIRECIQKDICIKTKALKHRPVKFKNLILALESNVEITEMADFISYMRDILLYPLPNKNCVVGETLQKDIVSIMKKFLSVLIKILNSTEFLTAQSLLGTIINKFLECALIINGNQTFMKKHVDVITVFKDLLTRKVQQMTNKDFN